MKLITYIASQKAKKIDNYNEWFAEIMNLVWTKGGGKNPYAGDEFEYALKSDGLFNNNIKKLYQILKEAELPQ